MGYYIWHYYDFDGSGCFSQKTDDRSFSFEGLGRDERKKYLLRTVLKFLLNLWYIRLCFYYFMEIKQAIFVKSSPELSQCPAPGLPEYAFIGRSNVGKSSLINMLCNRKSLAKISSRPGKTQLINHFLIDESWYLVDLPGYAWSKVSKKQKEQWGIMIEQYILKRQNLQCLFVLLDGRLEPQNIDYDFIRWLGEKLIPFALIFTKSDKLSKNRFESVKALHIKKLKAEWEELPTNFSSSVVTRVGQKEILSFIKSIN